MTGMSPSLQVRRLVYVSRSLIDADAEALDALVRHAAASNARNGITGMMWFDGANFAQVLEGEREAVGETMNRIEMDTRHADIAVVVDRDVEARAFGTWGMIRPDDGPACLASTAFLVGLSLSQGGEAARRLHDIIWACET